jgi:hypothetical protein
MFILEKLKGSYLRGIEGVVLMYIFLCITTLVVGLFFGIGMYFILKFTKSISQIYIRKIILNLVTALAIIIPFMIIASEIIGDHDEFMEYLPPFIFILTMSIWYFELEPTT